METLPRSNDVAFEAMSPRARASPKKGKTCSFVRKIIELLLMTPGCCCSLGKIMEKISVAGWMEAKSSSVVKTHQPFGLFLMTARSTHRRLTIKTQISEIEPRYCLFPVLPGKRFIIFQLLRDIARRRSGFIFGPSRGYRFAAALPAKEAPAVIWA